MLHKLEMSRYSLLNRPQSPTKGDTNVAFLDGNDEDEGYTLEERDIQKLFYQRHLTAVLVRFRLYCAISSLEPGYCCGTKITMYQIMSLVGCISHTIDDRKLITTAPLQNDIHYKTDTLATDGHEFGPPSPELDAAWSDMLQCGCFPWP